MKSINKNLYEALFKQKLLHNRHEITQNQAVEALRLDYNIKITSDGKSTLSVCTNYRGKLLISRNGALQKKEILKEYFKRPSTRYFLEGSLYDGEYIPF